MTGFLTSFLVPKLAQSTCVKNIYLAQIFTGTLPLSIYLATALIAQPSSYPPGSVVLCPLVW
jgi:hypothetical protein